MAIASSTCPHIFVPGINDLYLKLGQICNDFFMTCQSGPWPTKDGHGQCSAKFDSSDKVRGTVRRVASVNL